MPIVNLLEQCELFHPLIAIHASNNAQQMAQKNGLNFAQMLLPYAAVQTTIKEPIAPHTQIQNNLRLDFRDLRHNGLLLSHTVFRFVLQENILNNSEDKLGEGLDSLLSSSFYHAFIHWHESAEHEFLRAYLACIFIVSTTDADPLSKLIELESEQHREQHGEVGSTTNKRISPAYCVPPKWFFPNILKYYILVHDNSQKELNPQRSDELYASICARYGQNLCQLIHLNSADPTNPADVGMPDTWAPIIQRNELGFFSGLNLAKRNLLTPTKTINTRPNVLATSLPPVSSAPSLSHQDGDNSSSTPPVFTTSTAFNLSTFTHQCDSQQHINQIAPGSSSNLSPTYAQIARGSSMIESESNSTLGMQSSDAIDTNNDNENDNQVHGQWLSIEDRQRLRKLVEDFVRLALAPYVEKQLAEQNEIVLSRRSLTKNTFSSMRKWLQSATANATTIGAAQQPQGQAMAVSYSAESAECQSRRLADLAFLFGLYQYANQIYQSLKKDFANDQLYHAGCLEMASTSAFLASWQQFSEQTTSNSALKSANLIILRKQYPQRYMDNAVHFYANVCKQPLLALRALMNGVHILTHLEQYTEAAQQLIKFNTSTELAISDLIDAVLLEHAARLFAMASGRKRKTAFYLATAGTRMLKFATHHKDQMSAESLRNCKHLARRFYEEVLNAQSFTGKGWLWAEHYLLCQYISCI